jgi:hypothetical protein
MLRIYLNISRNFRMHLHERKTLCPFKYRKTKWSLNIGNWTTESWFQLRCSEKIFDILSPFWAIMGSSLFLNDSSRNRKFWNLCKGRVLWNRVSRLVVTEGRRPGTWPDMTHRPNNGGSTDLWNVGKLTPVHKALQPRRQVPTLKCPSF